MTPAELRAARKRLGLTQRQLAEALGVGRYTIILREQGKVSVARETLLAMRYLAIAPDARTEPSHERD